MLSELEHPGREIRTVHAHGLEGEGPLDVLPEDADPGAVPAVTPVAGTAAHLQKANRQNRRRFGLKETTEARQPTGSQP